MKRILPILACFVLVGCASKPKPPANATLPARHYEPASASALAFSPPVMPAYPLLGLDRASREPGAFIGYDEGTAEFYSIAVADHQSKDPWQETYDRVSSSEKTGVRYR